MTTLAFVAGLVLFGLWWLYRGYVIAGFNIYIVFFVVTLLTASIYAIRSAEPRNIAAASVLWAKFALHHWAWTTGNPLVWLAVFDLAGAAYFILIGTRPWEFTIGGLYLASVFVSAATVGGFIPGPSQRPDIFVAFSHPDAIAILGHLANCVLGAASGDGGQRIRAYLDMAVVKRPLALAARRSVSASRGFMDKSQETQDD